MKNAEIWRTVQGIDGKYEVSNMGRVRHYTSRYGFRPLKLSNDGNYLVFSGRKDGKRCLFRVHRIVAESFVGGIPTGYHVHHIDGDKHNNRADNLAIINPKEHVHETLKQHPDMLANLIAYNCQVKPKKICQLNGERVIGIFDNCATASRVTGVCQRNILYVAMHQQGRTQAGGFVWRFEDELKGGVLT